MIEEDGYYYHSDHVLDNMTPEEELAVSIFQHAIAGNKINIMGDNFEDQKFLSCIKVAERVTELLRLRHAKADEEAELAAGTPKFKVVPIVKST